MSHRSVPTRRSLLRGISGLAIGGGFTAQERARSAEPVQVPWSAGTEQPKLNAPPHATDCHHHIYDARFPTDPKAVLKPAPATVADYRLFQKRIGTTRNVVVQPSTYGVDNRCLLDSLGQFGTKDTRGIAVVNTDVSDAELKQLNEAGVRGIRFNLQQAGATSLSMLAALAKRITPLGWHVQMNLSSDQIMNARAAIEALPCPVVFDHFGHTTIRGREDPAFPVIVKLLQADKGWLKLSGAYIDSKVGAPAYGESVPTARAYIEEAPNRLVWGSDWPHPTTNNKPDDAVLFDLLLQWAPDATERHRILVENPARLYGFAQ
ncbi:MAG: amidohydrolase family protein [Bryobacteraceae bacterium]